MNRFWPVVAGLFVLILAVVAASQAGKASVPWPIQVQILKSALGFRVERDWPQSYETVLWSIRAPRIFAAMLVGGALSSAGAGYQGLFRNPLADPYLMGVASGAGLGAVIAFVLPWPALSGVGAVPLFAFAGAIGSVTLVYGIARVGRSTSSTMLILAGVAVGALANAAMAFLMNLHGEQLQMVYGWLLGGFNAIEWRQLGVIAPILLVSVGALLLCARLLNVLQLSEDQAMSLGVNVERARLGIVAAATLATAAAVSISGLIGFVGLIVPHSMRLLFGGDYRRLMPASILFGGAFLVLADAAARSVPGTVEIPVGVITAGCGAPFFLVLLRKRAVGVA